MAAIENWTDNGDGTHTLDEKFEYHDGHQLAVMPIGIRRKEHEARRLEGFRPKPTIIVFGFPNPVPAGASDQFTVTVLDGSKKPFKGYHGTVHFTSSDPQAVLPADYTFGPDDGGAGTFKASLKTPGDHWIKATDVALPSIASTQAVTVTPAPVRTITPAPGSEEPKPQPEAAKK